MNWPTSKRTIELSHPIVMGILNVTPDSFSDGGRFADQDAAIRRAEEMIAEGAAIVDVGGESTRPGSARVDEQIEIDRTAPVIEALASRFDIPISIDTTKASVAEAAMIAGAEIVNDISGLRFDGRMAEAAAKYRAGLVLMHSRGEFENMHSQPPVDDILLDVEKDLRRAIGSATAAGVSLRSIVLDPGIGFGKSVGQNLELIAKLDKIIGTFAGHPLLVGVSRKSFIGKLLGSAPADRRLSGSIAAAVVALVKGARILRVHDVKETVDAVRVTNAIIDQS